MPRRLVLRRSPIHGRGVFAAVDLPAGLPLIEYRGLRRTHAEADRLYGDGCRSGHTMLFTLNDRYVIDANVGGNWARFINHGCEPNCVAVLIEHRGGDRRRDRVVIETLRPIRAGEELTYDYGIVLPVPHTRELRRIWACRCGAPNCTGTLLRPRSRR